MIEQGAAGAKIGEVWIGHGEALVADIEVESGLYGVRKAGCKLPCKIPLVGGVGADLGQGCARLIDHPVGTDTCTDIAAKRTLGQVVVGGVEQDGDLVEGAGAVAGVVFPDNGVDRVVNEVAFDRETELGKDIVAGFEIVTDSGVENGFAINRLIAETCAPRLEKVHTDGSAKYWAFVRAEKILKRTRGVLRLFWRNRGRISGRRRVCAYWNDTNVFGAK